MFDLPVQTKGERKSATCFRNYLLDQGFEMAQFSVYMRFCTGPEQVETYTKRVQTALPTNGKVDIICFTDKQYEKIVSFVNRKRRSDRQNPSQYSLF